MMADGRNRLMDFKLPAWGTGWLDSLRGNLHGEPFQTRNVLEILGVGGEYGEVALHRLGGNPEVLHPKVGAAPHLRQFRREHAECLGGLAGNPQERLATQASEHGHGALLLLLNGHQLDAKPDCGQVDGRKIDGLLSRNYVNISGAQSSPLDRDPKAGINQEAHGSRSSLSVPVFDDFAP